jgi:UPF0755 protein
LKKLLGLIALVLVAFSVWLNLSATSQAIELAIPQGTSLRGVARLTSEAGVEMPEALTRWSLQLAGLFSRDSRVKAGLYAVPANASRLEVLGILLSGNSRLIAVRLAEGSTFADVRKTLAQAKWLQHDLTQADQATTAKLLGFAPGESVEGAFFPDTYTVAPMTSESAVLKLAAQAMRTRLAQVWSQRNGHCVLRDPRDALILASIIEKETGLDADRPMVAAVFNNRLRIGMRLQTDPTVIYGLGERFDGNLRKRDLLTDTAYNTYTRSGLPPSPIALPSAASLLAAVQPALVNSLYFVARGDGTSQFSDDLAAHNRAVNQYQR